jgi:hypothetical protein
MADFSELIAAIDNLAEAVKENNGVRQNPRLVRTDPNRPVTISHEYLLEMLQTNPNLELVRDTVRDTFIIQDRSIARVNQRIARVNQRIDELHGIGGLPRPPQDIWGTEHLRGGEDPRRGVPGPTEVADEGLQQAAGEAPNRWDPVEERILDAGEEAAPEPNE